MSYLLTQKHLLDIVPHRPPFLLLDGIQTGHSEEVVAEMVIDKNAFYFNGHFPNNPVVPGIILIEAMAQNSLVLYHFNYKICDLLFLVKSKASFYHSVFPGDTLIIKTKKIKIVPNMGLTQSTIYNVDKKIAYSELGFKGKPKGNPTA